MSLCRNGARVDLHGINYFGFEVTPTPPRLRCAALFMTCSVCSAELLLGVLQNGQTATDGLYQGPTALSFGAHSPHKLPQHEVTPESSCTKWAASADASQSADQQHGAQTS